MLQRLGHDSFAVAMALLQLVLYFNVLKVSGLIINKTESWMGIFLKLKVFCVAHTVEHQFEAISPFFVVRRFFYGVVKFR